MNRRKFLHAAGVAAVAGTTAGCRASKSPFRFFTLAEAATLRAVCAGIVPEDRDPGATQAAVIHYIDRQLTRTFREYQKTYRAGLAEADRMAGGNFAAIPPDRQLTILRQMEHAPATRPFFDLAVAHSMQGFYGNPRHGGNRDFASWRMLRVPISPIRGRDLYRPGDGGGDAKG